MSGTGYIVFISSIMIILSRKKSFRLLLLFIPIIFFLVFMNIGIITGRGEYAKRSLGGRIETFIKLIDNSKMISGNFGRTTNAGVDLTKKYLSYSEAIGVDSTYSSIIGNYGLLVFGLFMILYLLWIIIILRINCEEIYIFTLIFSFFAITQIITESFPANLLFAVCLAYYLKKHIKINSKLRARRI